MKELVYIEAKRELTNAENYEFLRKEGQKHIESLGHNLWTDFNVGEDSKKGNNDNIIKSCN